MKVQGVEGASRAPAILSLPSVSSMLTDTDRHLTSLSLEGPSGNTLLRRSQREDTNTRNVAPMLELEGKQALETT